MATYSFPQKLHLLLDFLLGARLAEVYGPLEEIGWTSETLEHGWRLVEQAGRARYSGERLSAHRAAAELLEFKKRWFPTVRIVLEKRSPAIAARLLGRIAFRDQASAVYFVEPFLNVLDELEASDNAEERAARELLRTRGLSASVKEAAERLVLQARQVAITKTSDALLEAEARAEKELWDFYVEWSSLTRRAIKNGSVLRLLGLTKLGRPVRSPEPETHPPLRLAKAAPAPVARRLAAPSLPLVSEDEPSAPDPADEEENSLESATAVSTDRSRHQ